MARSKGPFSFDLPPASRRLADAEYVALVNRIRGNFISYVAALDGALTMVITDFFLRDKHDIALWAGSVLDDERVSFGTKCIWFSKIISNHRAFGGVSKADRKKISDRLSRIRRLRNDFAHNYAYNKQVDPRDVRERVIRLYDYEDGVTKIRKFKMQDVVDIIDDPWLGRHVQRAAVICRRIREGGA